MLPSVPPPHPSVYPRAPSYAPPSPSFYPPRSLSYAPPRPSPRLASPAVVALVLGLLAFFLGPFTGIAAIVVGALARRDIDRSNGALEGRSLAAGGIVAGIFGMGFVLVVVLSAFDAMLAREEPIAAPSTTVRAEAP